MYKKPDGVLLLLLFGIYFVLDYVTTDSLPDLIFGVILLYYHFRFLYEKRKSV